MLPGTTVSRNWDSSELGSLSRHFYPALRDAGQLYSICLTCFFTRFYFLPQLVSWVVALSFSLSHTGLRWFSARIVLGARKEDASKLKRMGRKDRPAASLYVRTCVQRSSFKARENSGEVVREPASGALRRLLLSQVSGAAFNDSMIWRAWHSSSPKEVGETGARARRGKGGRGFKLNNHENREKYEPS